MFDTCSGSLQISMVHPESRIQPSSCSPARYTSWPRGPTSSKVAPAAMKTQKARRTVKANARVLHTAVPERVEGIDGRRGDGIEVVGSEGKDSAGSDGTRDHRVENPTKHSNMPNTVPVSAAEVPPKARSEAIRRTKRAKVHPGMMTRSWSLVVAWPLAAATKAAGWSERLFR